ncbi:putative feruloyl esterase [Lindgomyces ingoldianus]|uniref:Feruloyl esterase n=1 Tax=Lindgomyces ingoldianus TaxID=673940 RepID=A0ACB6RAZ9_9PLEO|nr:putative feruloyl esterase [Lindgomyces ingoldianus]KAF2475507.1 putative feruloyl esterase [Lindgomyces ingoldianus]
MHLSIFLSSLALLPLGVHSGVVETFQSKCANLAHTVTAEAKYDIHINIVEYLPAGSVINHTADGTNETCSLFASPTSLPVNICRLALKAATSNSSSIILETWLPENWSGRFLSTGNGGLSGCIQYSDIAYATKFGFAAVGANNGHNGTSGGAFFHQPEVLKDFVWRSLYTGVVLGKNITSQFYGKDKCKAMKSYYIGCSTGGRQAWKAVQSYPELFDGVIAGAPAIASNGLISFFGYAFQSLGDNSSDTFLDTQNWETLHEEVLSQCDHLDGAVDGILEDTRKCKPNLTKILCENTSRPGCLSQAQVSAVEKVFSPVVVDGQVIASGQQHGDEVRMINALYGPLPGTWLEEYFRFVIYQNLSWNRTMFSLQDAAVALKANLFNVETFDGDLRAFRDRGAKVLHFHGQADEYLPVGNSDRYYDLVAKTMGSSNAELDEFYRYFRISGLGHCFGGPGTNYLGQHGGTAASDDPDDNMLMRIVEWVEHGKAPEFVRGTKFVNDDPAQGVAFTRKHCKHPKVNVYKGRGNGTDENGWHCV